MARGATKASSNVWYRARMEAAKADDRLYSREGAAEKVNMSVDAIKNTELGLEKCMPVEKAVLLADAYRAPHLLNHYCLHECPIGRNAPMSDEVLSIDRVTVKLIKNLKTSELERLKDKLLDIAEDGEVSQEEQPELEEIVEYLDGLSRTLSELRLISQQVVHQRGGRN